MLAISCFKKPKLSSAGPGVSLGHKPAPQEFSEGTGSQDTSVRRLCLEVQSSALAAKYIKFYFFPSTQHTSSVNDSTCALELLFYIATCSLGTTAPSQNPCASSWRFGTFPLWAVGVGAAGERESLLPEVLQRQTRALGSALLTAAPSSRHTDLHFTHHRVPMHKNPLFKLLPDGC